MHERALLRERVFDYLTDKVAAPKNLRCDHRAVRVAIAIVKYVEKFEAAFF